MVKFYSQIEPHLQTWAMSQAVFFIASSPLHGKHINLSPKGLPATSFSILSPNLCAYVDATGSGIETVSHIRENGRATVMFCSFGASPQIMRFFCKGRIVEWNEPGFAGWLKRMGGKDIKGARAVVLLEVFKAQTSCGYAVPYLALKEDPENADKQIPYLEDRHTLGHWADKQVAANTINEYRSRMNARSLDGLPGLKVARKDAGERVWLGDMVASLKKNGGAQLALVALVSVLFTILSMYLLGLTTFTASRISWQRSLRGLRP